MCTGPTHATIGFTAGLAATEAYGTITGHPVAAGVTMVAAMLAAGGALLNDLDSHTSTASSAVGPVTAVVGSAVCGLSRFAFTLTATRADRSHTKGTHRGLTHTGLFVPAAGFAVYGLCTWLGKPAILGTLFAVMFLGLRGLPPKNKNLTDLIVAAIGTALAWATLPPATSGVLIGAAVAAGVLSHTLADALTTNGVPFFWPLPLGSQCWRHVGTPRFLRFHTGGTAEKIVFAIACLAAVVELVALAPIGRASIHALYTSIIG